MSGYQPRLTREMFDALTVGQTHLIVRRACRAAAAYKRAQEAHPSPQQNARFQDAMDELVVAVPVVVVAREALTSLEPAAASLHTEATQQEGGGEQI